MAKKIKVPKSKIDTVVIIIAIIQQIVELIATYGPRIVKVLKKLFASLRKSGPEGINGLEKYLAKEEKKRSAAGKKKVIKRKKPEKTKTSVKHKVAKTRKTKGIR